MINSSPKKGNKSSWQGQTLAVYKQKALTSHQVINMIRRITGVKKVGHAGTLDPFATGVLVIGIGREATRKLNQSVAKEKEYIGRIHLGWTSDTEDPEGNLEKIDVKQIPSAEIVEQTVQSFVGEIRQRPPQFSAIKVRIFSSMF